MWTTYWRANSRTDTDREIPLIGEPIANNEVYIVDKDNNLQPIGVKGELCIAGVSLARGYLNKSELTAEKFIDNPFGTGKMYKTGDLARWLPNGKLQFLGRTTNQVQIEGYTVQLEKVENKLLTYQHVEQATVIAKEEGADKHLIAYVIANQKLATSKLRDYLSEQVLDYMVPADFIQLKQDAVSQIQEDQDDNDSMEVEFDI